MFTRIVISLLAAALWLTGNIGAAYAIESHQSYPSWSPDGSLLAYDSGQVDFDSDSVGGWLGVITSDGQNDTAILTPQLRQNNGQNELFYYTEIEWSPKGDRIAFVVADLGIVSNGIWTVNSDGSGLKQITRNGHDPTWSADGRNIALGHDGDIYVISSNPRQPLDVKRSGENLTENLRPELNEFVRVAEEPSWSPDGNFIAFSNKRAAAGSPYIYIMDSEGINYRKVYGPGRGFGSFEELTWSPDGRQIAFEDSAIGDQGKIYRISAVGRPNIKYITDGSDPDWSSKDEIAFRGDNYCESQNSFVKGSLYAIRPDGSAKRLIANTDGFNEACDKSNPPPPPPVPPGCTPQDFTVTLSGKKTIRAKSVTRKGGVKLRATASMPASARVMLRVRVPKKSRSKGGKGRKWRWVTVSRRKIKLNGRRFKNVRLKLNKRKRSLVQSALKNSRKGKLKMKAVLKASIIEQRSHRATAKLGLTASRKKVRRSRTRTARRTVSISSCRSTR